MPRLENWSVIGYLDPYQAPECQSVYLNGEIYDDEKGRFSDNSKVTTSRIVSLDLVDNIAQTKNTKYILGKVSEEYAKWLDKNNIILKEVYK